MFNEELDKAMDDLSKCLKETPIVVPSAGPALHYNKILKVFWETSKIFSVKKVIEK